MCVCGKQREREKEDGPMTCRQCVSRYVLRRLLRLPFLSFLRCVVAASVASALKLMAWAERLRECSFECVVCALSLELVPIHPVLLLERGTSLVRAKRAQRIMLDFRLVEPPKSSFQPEGLLVVPLSGHRFASLNTTNARQFPTFARSLSVYFLSVSRSTRSSYKQARSYKQAITTAFHSVFTLLPNHSKLQR